MCAEFFCIRICRQEKKLRLADSDNQRRRKNYTLTERALKAGISNYAGIVICDGVSANGCTDEKNLKNLDVNTLLVKKDSGKQSAQLRRRIFWSLQHVYYGILTIGGNDKDNIEDVPKFTEKLYEGYDFIQGSRFIKGGKAINAPIRQMLISLTRKNICPTKELKFCAKFFRL